MQRGILKITSPEAQELIKNLDLNKYRGLPLENKLSSINYQQPEVEVLLSEDEVEKILDEIGYVDSSSNPLLANVMYKVTELMGSFRS